MLDNPHWVTFDSEKFFVDKDCELDFTGGEGIIAQTYLKIKPGEVFFDVGAAGAMWMLYALSKGAYVYAFEPAKIQFNRLLDYLKANHKLEKKAIVFQEALGNRSEVGTIDRWAAEHGWKGERSADSCLEVKMETLDSFLPLLNRLDWMKIDVEGAEYDVLLGGKKTLEKFKPNLIIEDHSNVDQIGAWMKENKILCKMITLLCSLGYGVHMHPHQGRAFLIATQGTTNW